MPASAWDVSCHVATGSIDFCFPDFLGPSLPSTVKRPLGILGRLFTVVDEISYRKLRTL